MFLICSSHNPICLLALSIRFYKNKCRLHKNRNLPCSLAAYPSILKCCLACGKNPKINAKRKERNALPTQVPFLCCASFLVTMVISSIHIRHIFAHIISRLSKNNDDLQTLLFWFKGRGIHPAEASSPLTVLKICILKSLSVEDGIVLPQWHPQYELIYIALQTSPRALFIGRTLFLSNVQLGVTKYTIKAIKFYYVLM